MGAADPCDNIRGENLLHHVLNDNILAAKFFFTAIQTQDPNLLNQCISRWDRYFPVPRPKYPDSPFIRTPLTEAARRGNMGMVRLLVQQGADVNKQSEGGFILLKFPIFIIRSLEFVLYLNGSWFQIHYICMKLANIKYC